ncbi:MAG: MTH1187 family thiamine-binding protein [Chloroflexota bacterium]
MSRTINVSVQVLPLHPDPYPIVDRAIEAIQQSGVKYEVGPLETTLEGELDELLEVVKAAHRACFVAGAEKVVTLVKIADSVTGTTIAEKVSKYR